MMQRAKTQGTRGLDDGQTEKVGRGLSTRLLGSRHAVEDCYSDDDTNDYCNNHDEE